MTESVAARVDESTKTALEQEADDRDESVSAVAADVLDQWAAAADDGSDSGGSVRRTTLTDGGDLADDVEELRDDLNMVVSRCRRLTAEQEFLIRNANGVYKSLSWEEYPPLPGDNSRAKSRPTELDELADLDM